jgi:hypothetical protein
MIRHLRQQEEVMLYANLLQTSSEEERLVADFLKAEYESETLEYPYKPPLYNEKAALYGARTVYVAAQLLLYRENKVEDIAVLLPGFTAEITASEALSADLCMRFLPDIIIQLKAIDPDDALIPLLDKILGNWHYSGIGYIKNMEGLNFSILTSDKCLNQMYINRVIDKKENKLAALPQLVDSVNASLGNYRTELWN